MEIRLSFGHGYPDSESLCRLPRVGIVLTKMHPRYRMFGELLELAVAAGLHIPVSLPSYMAVDSHMMSPGGTQLAENVLVSTTTPLTTLQHPGYYFYTAANCTAQRKEKFALMNEVSRPTFTRACA